MSHLRNFLHRGAEWVGLRLNIGVRKNGAPGPKRWPPEGPSSGGRSYLTHIHTHGFRQTTLLLHPYKKRRFPTAYVGVRH